jgi:hypothetical protein
MLNPFYNLPQRPYSETQSRLTALSATQSKPQAHIRTYRTLTIPYLTPYPSIIPFLFSSTLVSIRGLDWTLSVPFLFPFNFSISLMRSQGFLAVRFPFP